MQVLVVLVAQHRLTLQTFERHGTELLDKSRMPPAIAEKVSLLARTFNPIRANGQTFEEFILRGGAYEETPNTPRIDGVVVLYEASMSHALASIRNAIFAAEVPNIGYLENVQNFLFGNFSTLLGNFGLLIDKLQDATQCQAASLPIRNFCAAELRSLVEVCRMRSLERTFQNDIVPSLNRLLKRRGPKRRSSYPNVYFKDDSKRYFEYGHEVHSKYETGGSHRESCMINGRFRFGTSLSQERHFNVTVGDSDAKLAISCNLPNCHGEVVTVNARTHVNMFSNDFHK